MTNITYKLCHAVTAYDRKRVNRRDYNRYALGHYLGAVGRVTEDLAAGVALRAALVRNFNGRLLDVCLRAVGEPPATDKEQRF